MWSTVHLVSWHHPWRAKLSHQDHFLDEFCPLVVSSHPQRLVIVGQWIPTYSNIFHVPSTFFPAYSILLFRMLFIWDFCRATRPMPNQPRSKRPSLHVAVQRGIHRSNDEVGTLFATGRRHYAGICRCTDWCIIVSEQDWLTNLSVEMLMESHGCPFPRFLFHWFHHVSSSLSSTWNGKWHAVASDLAMVFCSERFMHRMHTWKLEYMAVRILPVKPVRPSSENLAFNGMTTRTWRTNGYALKLGTAQSLDGD